MKQAKRFKIQKQVEEAAYHTGGLNLDSLERTS
jgi:hypothetical protein